jgi:hypothetical protein
MRSHAPGSFAWMNRSRLERLLLFLIPGGLWLFATLPLGQVANASEPVTSEWVYYDAGHRLQYKTLPDGDRIMDFSTAGYEQGAAPIPEVPVQVTLGPSGGDDTGRIQGAIEQVSKLGPGPNGLRGAVLLLPGAYSIGGSLAIQTSGVVLRGSGSGASPESSTVMTLRSAKKPYPLFVLGARDERPKKKGHVHHITDGYVRSGFNTLHLDSTAGLEVGDRVIITRPVTPRWVAFMGMDDSGCGSARKKPCWIESGSERLRTDRTITAMAGDQITLDAPMSDSIDSRYCGSGAATLEAYTFPGRISQVGVERVRAIAPAIETLVPGDATYQLAVARAVENAWVRDLTAQDTQHSVVIGEFSKQVTVQGVQITHTVEQAARNRGAMFEEFYISSATQVLMENLADTADKTLFFSTSAQTQGPNVLRDSEFTGNNSRVEPHQRWATGLLVENTHIRNNPRSTSKIPNTINLCDRGRYGSFHGWAIGWGVVWNCSADRFTIQAPPGSQNWCIGCRGTQEKKAAPGGGSKKLPQGAIDARDETVTPLSLYAAQLEDRLGGSPAPH